MVSRPIPNLIQQSKTTFHLYQLRPLILKTGLDHNPQLVSQLILSACSISVTIAKSIFCDIPIVPPLFSYNVLIRAFSKSSTPVESVKLFSQLQRVGLKPDNFTYPFVLKACGRCLLVGEGGVVQSGIVKMGLYSDKYIGNTLLRMYAAFGAIERARKVFDELTVRDVASWSSMIAASVACNFPSDAIMLFQSMKHANEKPNSVTLVSLLSACTHLLNISTGESIHSYIIRNCMEFDAALGTALLELYSKCGHIEKALHIFNSLTEKNLQSWTIMISGLSDHGHEKDAICLFSKMETTGLLPDSLSFCSILSACSHMGLVYEGQKYFHKMINVYNIKPTVEHYGCMVDLFGRAGMIEEAYNIINEMPMEPNSIILRSFLGACKNQGLVVSIDKKLLAKLELDLGANYVLTANLHFLSGSWNDAAGLRVAMKNKRLDKMPGCSWVQVHGY